MPEPLRNVIRLIPKDQREPVSTALLDLLLKTKAAQKVPARDAKRVLNLMMQDLIATETGLETLFTCVLYAEPEKTLESLGEVLGGMEVAEEVVNALSKVTLT